MSTSLPDDSMGSDDDQTATLVLGGLIIVLAIITVGLRFYTRLFTKQGIKWDDWLILAAVTTTLVTAGLLVWGSAADSTGAAASDTLDPNYAYTSQDIMYMKLTFIASVLYFAIAGSTKLGILLMYYRIFNMDRAFRYQLALAILLVVAWWIGCEVASLTNCIPLQWSWLNSLSDPRYCFNYNIFWVASGAIEAFIDTIVLGLPIRVIITLQLTAKKKAAAACIFLLGSFVIITGVLKVIYGYVPDGREPSLSRGLIWTIIHTAMAIVCASLPLFKPLVAKMLQLPFASKLVIIMPSYRFDSAESWQRLGRGRLNRGRLGATRRGFEVSNISSELGSFGSTVETRMPIRGGFVQPNRLSTITAEQIMRDDIKERMNILRL